MIIWGWRGITSTTENIQFHCPQCDDNCAGVIKQVRNFFTIYFIPIIPLNVSGRYVECNSCAGSFGEEILSYDPEVEKKQNEERMLRLMVMAALADGRVDDLERGEINKQYQEFTGLPVAQHKLDTEIKMAMSANTDLNAFVGGFASELSDHGKALVVKLAFHTMSAGGDLQPGHQTQLIKLSSTLGIPEDQYMTLIDEISKIE